MLDDNYTELLINKARYVLQYMDEHDAMYYLKDGGADPGMCYLIVKAAKILLDQSEERSTKNT